jgi:hypothetical protein
MMIDTSRGVSPSGFLKECVNLILMLYRNHTNCINSLASAA